MRRGPVDHAQQKKHNQHKDEKDQPRRNQARPPSPGNSAGANRAQFSRFGLLFQIHIFKDQIANEKILRMVAEAPAEKRIYTWNSAATRSKQSKILQEACRSANSS